MIFNKQSKLSTKNQNMPLTSKYDFKAYKCTNMQNVGIKMLSIRSETTKTI